MKNNIVKSNVAVVFGGRSVEHDISIITGVQTLNALDKQKYNILPIYLNKEGRFLTSNSFFNIKTFSNDKFLYNDTKLKQLTFGFDGWLYLYKNKKLVKFKKIDFVFLATHGGEGENGSLQGYLDICSIPYSSSNCLSSAICMNKLITKQILEQNNICITKYVCISQKEYTKNSKCYLDKIRSLKFPLIVKPCNLGSSIGINFCKTKTEIKNALSFAFLFDEDVLIEEAVENLREVNVSIMGNKFNFECSDIEEIVLTKDFLTFENKYMNKESSSKGMGNASRNIPANLSVELKEKVLELASKAFVACLCSGIVRIDFLINSKTNEVFLNEINTIPGSLSNYLWNARKYNFSKILDQVKKYSLENFDSKKSKVKNFSTSVLSQFETSKKLKLSK